MDIDHKSINELVELKKLQEEISIFIDENELPKSQKGFLMGLFTKHTQSQAKENKELKEESDNQQGNGVLPCVSGSLPSVDEAGVMAVKISETLEDKLTAQEQAFFIAGFCECVKWLGSNDR